MSPPNNAASAAGAPRLANLARGAAPFNDCGGVEKGAAVDLVASARNPHTRADDETWLRLPGAYEPNGSRRLESRVGSGPQSPMTPAQARAAGLRYYFGAPCAYGHHRRYTANRMCVTCSSAHSAARKRGTPREPPPPAPLEYIAPSLEVGRRLGLVKYHGRPHTCGSTVRYVGSTKCCACQNARRARDRAAARETR